MDEELKETLKNIPQSCGVYKFYDQQGSLLYVGKAKNLRSRILSYFGDTDKRPYVDWIKRRIKHVEFVVTKNVIDAMILENELIKRLSPEYNIKLKDDKNFLVLRIAKESSFPKIELTRRIDSKKYRYFGPFSSAADARAVKKIVMRLFGLRTCNDSKFKRHKNSACILKQINRCSGPCDGSISKEDYQRLVEDAIDFLSGKIDKTRSEIEKSMFDAARNLEFERAAYFRNLLITIESMSSQRSCFEGVKDAIAFGITKDQENIFIGIARVANSRLFESSVLRFENNQISIEDTVSQFLLDFFSTGFPVPSTVVISERPSNLDNLEEYLSKLSGHRTKIVIPKRGRLKALMDFAKENAAIGLNNLKERKKRLFEDLQHIQQRLGLNRLPYIIEGFDVSNLGDRWTVGAMVVYINGIEETKRFRKFRLDEIARNDQEAIYRMLKKRLNSLSIFWQPDLILIDGGTIQLKAALRAIREIGKNNIEVVAIAKGDRDRLFRAGHKDAITIKGTSDPLFLLSKIRDRVHSFVLGYHKNIRNREWL